MLAQHSQDWQGMGPGGGGGIVPRPSSHDLTFCSAKPAYWQAAACINHAIRTSGVFLLFFFSFITFLHDKT